MEFNKETHKSVEGQNIFFQTPQVGDIVKAFNRDAVIVKDFTNNGSDRPVFEVVFIDHHQEKTGMPFGDEIKVIAKTNDNWNSCEVVNINARVNAQFAFEQFQNVGW